MKIKRIIDNGNKDLHNKYGIISTVLINPESRDIDIINNLNSLLNYEIVQENTRSVVNINLNKIKTAEGEVIVNNNNDGERVEDFTCNQQFQPNGVQIGRDIDSTACDYMNVARPPSILSEAVASLSISSKIANCDNEIFSAKSQVLDNCMTLNGPRDVPRGIINPNYPGFQHFAHTLQDYTTPIDLPHSENDTTDDDNDTEMNDVEAEESTTILSDSFSNFINNNGIEVRDFAITNKSRVDIPDILKTANGHNSIDSLYCDIENNFQTRDIIGNFNKEIEDEIKQVLNYNLNIQEDLKELKKEINVNLSKPIEKTINNISDVVNQVIKKLVKTQCHAIEAELNSRRKSSNSGLSEVNELKKAEDKNDFKEMIRNQPSFFVFENNINSQIADAFLSDGKDELEFNEQDYAAEKVEISVENTLKQLSSELRKIIPKLDKLRERETVTSRYQNGQVFFDGNFYQQPCSSLDILPANNAADSCNAVADTEGYKEHKLNNILNQSDSTKIHKTETRVPSSNPGLKHVSVQKQKSADENNLGSFDVFNIETALPKLDIDAIEIHLKAAKEAERRGVKRTTRAKRAA